MSKRNTTTHASSSRLHDESPPPPAQYRRKQPVKRRKQTTSTAKAAKLSIRPPPNPPPTLPWLFEEPKHQERYHSLFPRTIICTRYMDNNALDQLHILAEVNALWESIGWTRFAQQRYPTYKELTLEFLSSFFAKLYPYSREERGEIKFRLMGIDRVLNIDELNAIMGFDSSGHQRIPNNFNPRLAWYDIRGKGDYKPGVTKSTQLTSHAIRYTHRVLAQTILARGGSPGAVTLRELFFLWAMKTGQKVSGGFWLCNHLRSVAKVKTGKIAIGGLITAIAYHFGFRSESASIHLIKNNTRIDLMSLTSMSMCVNNDGKYFLIDDYGDIIENDVPVDPIVQEFEGGGILSNIQHMEEDQRETNEVPIHNTIPPVPHVDDEITLTRVIARLDNLECFVRDSFQSLQSKLDTLLGEGPHFSSLADL